MKKFRFGCHNFLNSQPILVPLIEKKIEELEIIQDSPANLALMLKRGKLDLSFVPSIEYARNPDYKLVDKISISSCGAVDTVLLISKIQMDAVQSVAADNRSLSSIILLKILFKEKYNRIPRVRFEDPDLNKMLFSDEAALLIGDKSFAADKKGKEIYDLGSEWFQITGKPFVHALLCARNEIPIDKNIIKSILDARDKGLSSLDKLSIEAAKTAGISEDKCVDYLKNRIIYRFGQAEQDGLKEYFSLAYKHGLITRQPELKFLF